jgi:hypothetical protein
MFKKKLALSSGTEIHFDWYTFLPQCFTCFERRMIDE